MNIKTTFSYGDWCQLELLQRLELFLEGLLRVNRHGTGILIGLIDEDTSKFVVRFYGEAQAVHKVCREFSKQSNGPDSGLMHVHLALTTYYGSKYDSDSVPIIIEFSVPELELTLNIFEKSYLLPTTEKELDTILPENRAQRAAWTAEWLGEIQKEAARLRRKQSACEYHWANPGTYGAKFKIKTTGEG